VGNSGRFSLGRLSVRVDRHGDGVVTVLSQTDLDGGRVAKNDSLKDNERFEIFIGLRP
jgi:hypothetical protein